MAAPGTWVDQHPGYAVRSVHCPASARQAKRVVVRRVRDAGALSRAQVTIVGADGGFRLRFS